MKLLTILGARPQFIKASSLSREIKNHSDVDEVIIHTGQHYDNNMSSVFFDEMKIHKPKYFLGIGGGSHAEMTGKMLIKIGEILNKENPDWVVVYGDTNSTLAGALAASKLNIKVAHIEAGLRSFNMSMPEEINRILTDRISSLLFCPTATAVQNLKVEGFDSFDCNIHNVGDIMREGALYYSKISKPPLNFKKAKPFNLVTIHRAENTDDPLKIKSIFSALNELGKNSRLILPLHPRTQKVIKNLKIDTSYIELISPLGYLEMIWMISNSKKILTDSGGLQKEAFFFSKPCITLREETEWVELVDNNFNILVGSDKTKITEAFYSHVFNPDFNLDLYGVGSASKKIVSIMKQYKL
ncbi:UDP-N-acetylglucosamine 2-epimerase (non-hydrolyzing) [Flavobacteriaceae bacterium]|nr:UDP-N-acetylglucosamine 2-epimerase (non-hydrolyzing) [Flavobacteriaceae bacterium]MDB4715204.1 UDP-N-acetylglucosamine 2-epimerase (non-hydrolyzing) [Flavobacteriaceae bacterium]